MGLYAKYVLPKLIEGACGQAPVAEVRSQYVPHATGRVLEIGLGTGHNLAHYTDAVSEVCAVDPAVEITDLARDRVDEAIPDVDVINASAELLPFDDDDFDTVVSTWTLCSIPNVYRALAEIRRVIRPDGRFVFVEHGASPDTNVARWQRRLEPVWKHIGGGCHLTRNAPELIEAAGFDVPDTVAGYLPGPRWAAFTFRGIARPR